MKAPRSRSTKTTPAWTPRLSRSPRVTIALIAERESDLAACVARLSAQCERSGSDGVIVTIGGASITDDALGRRVRLVSAPAGATSPELRHLAMQHADGDIVLLEDLTTEAGPSDGLISRDLSGRARAGAPFSEWRDILVAHGVHVTAFRPSSRGLARVDTRTRRENRPIVADAHRSA